MIAIDTTHKSRIHEMIKSFIHSNISHCTVLCKCCWCSIHACIDGKQTKFCYWSVCRTLSKQKSLQGLFVTSLRSKSPYSQAALTAELPSPKRYSYRLSQHFSPTDILKTNVCWSVPIAPPKSLCQIWSETIFKAINCGRYVEKTSNMPCLPSL